MRRSSWLKSGSSWYYFKPDGTMAADETLVIDNKAYTFNANGVWVS
jgi:glucan-binding YG repeat protein